MCASRYAYRTYKKYYGIAEAKSYRVFFIHIDLIKGLSHDEFASEFIIQQYKPKGIVSTKSKVIKKAKSLNTLTIFRVFIIDSQALKRSIDLIKKVNLILLKYFQVLRVKRFIIFRKKQTHKSLQVA